MLSVFFSLQSLEPWPVAARLGRRVGVWKRQRPCMCHERRWLHQRGSLSSCIGAAYAQAVFQSIRDQQGKKKQWGDLDFISRVCRWCCGPPDITCCKQSEMAVPGLCHTWAALLLVTATWCFPSTYERTSVLLPYSHGCVFFFFLGRFSLLTQGILSLT